MGGAVRRLVVVLVVVLAAVAPVGLSSHYGNNDCGGSGDASNSVSDAWQISPGTCHGIVSAQHQDGADYYKIWAVVGQKVSVSSGTTNVRLCLSGPGGGACGQNDPDPTGGGWGGAAISIRATSDGFFSLGVTEVSPGYSFLRYSVSVQVAGSRNTQPVMEHLSCAPANPFERETVTCQMRARDDSWQVQYRVQWGDGTEEYVPPGLGAGAPPGTTVSATHVFPALGPYTVTVTAADPPPVPWESSPLTTRVTLRPNQAPVLPPVTCTPNPVNPWHLTTCSFAASDDGGLVWYSVDFGDGEPPVRVPETGTAAAGALQSAGHRYRELGSYTVTVTASDVQPLPRSAVRTVALTVQENAAPAFATAQCAPDGWAGRAHTCTFVVADDSSGVFVEVDWGDGTVERLPASGTVLPGTVLTASHTYPIGTYTVSARATDDNATALTSPTLSRTVRLHPEQVVTGKLVAGHPGTLRASTGLEGVDAAEIALIFPAGSTERITLTWYPRAGFADLNAYFYDADGDHLPFTGCATLRVGGSETCLPPPGTARVEVAAAYGVDITYTLRYGPA